MAYSYIVAAEGRRPGLGRGRIAAVLVALTALSGIRTEARGSVQAIPRHTMSFGAFYRVRTAKRLVALTFDDGPDARVTPAVLALLAQYHAHATFFVVGRRAETLPAIVGAEMAAGDEIGNHTFDHAHLLQLSDSDLSREIVEGDHALQGIGVPAPTWFRPPYGLASDRAYEEARVLGERMVLWSLSIDRLSHAPSIEAIARAIMDRVHPGDIILAHDCCPPFDRMKTVAVLKAVLPLLEARGYRVVTISQLVAAGAP